MGLYTCERCGRAILTARLATDFVCPSVPKHHGVEGKCPDCGWKLGKKFKGEGERRG